jgi:hypothetical protein
MVAVSAKGKMWPTPSSWYWKNLMDEEDHLVSLSLPKDFHTQVIDEPGLGNCAIRFWIRQDFENSNPMI